MSQPESVCHHLKSKNRLPISPLSYPEVFSRFFSIRFRENGWLAFPLFPLKCSNILHYRFFSESISSNGSVFSIDYSCKWPCKIQFLDCKIQFLDCKLLLRHCKKDFPNRKWDFPNRNYQFRDCKLHSQQFTRRYS